MVKWNEKTDIVKKLTESGDVPHISKSLHLNKASKKAYESLNIDISDTERRRYERKKSKRK